MGNITDANGNFSLSDVAPNAVISVSYIGYKTQEIALNGKTAVNVILSEDSEALDEVVVIGYGTQKKAEPVRSCSYSAEKYWKTVRF